MMYYAINMVDGSTALLKLHDSADIDAEIKKWHPDRQAEIVSYEQISPHVIPEDRTFRNAWVLADCRIAVNMDKARDIHRERLRTLRAPMLAALDIDYQRADEAGNAGRKRAIATRKQALRDVTADPAIDAAQTPDELKAVLPAILKP
jgi:hypothetical protein